MDNNRKYGEDLKSIPKWNFYVDVMLKRFPDVRTAADMIQRIKLLCKEGGFNLTKFSTSRDVLRSIRNDGVKDKDLNLGTLSKDKTLGGKWNISGHTVGFIIRMENKPATNLTYWQQ